MKVPSGYSFSGIAAGIKVKRRDLGLILSSGMASAAGCFTQSAVRAPSVEWSEKRVPQGNVRAIVALSGNANALTGPQAALDCEAVVRAVADELDVPPDQVLIAATGALGVPLAVGRVVSAMPQLVSSLEEDPKAFSESILTTDKRTKVASREVFVGGTRVRVLGVGKGSGMVHPKMATVLGFILTDASISPGLLSEMLKRSVADSFDMVSVDQQTSTNDAVLALANGECGGPMLHDGEDERSRLVEEAIAEVCDDLAREVARDGEGAQKLIISRVLRAENKAAARAFARSPIESSLVKAALFGADPNFGRVVVALAGRARDLGRGLDVTKLSIDLQGVRVFEHGAPTDFDGDALRAKLRASEVSLLIDLEEGEAQATAYGCDLSYDYVRINADYAAVMVDSADGPVRRDNRLDTKTPDLKAEILVAALGYIERFRGKRAVISFGNATLGSSESCARFAEDIRLLAGVGLDPILLQRGSISNSMVEALSGSGARAIGLTPADGNLLRTGPSGEVTVNPEVLELLLGKGFVPVVMPPEGGDETVAAALAISIKAEKIIFLGEGAGLTVEGSLLSELGADELRARLEDGLVPTELVDRANACVRAISGGVETAHLIAELVPHNVVAELFTRAGVGTMIR